MSRITATVSAPGREFTCEDDQPMTNCTAGSFDISACCPTNMTSDGQYLNPPIYEVNVFFLLKTNKTCPQLYSFTSTEEYFTIPNATISPGFPETLANTSSGDLKISFCRYSNVTCTKRAQVSPYEMFDVISPCKREYSVFCNKPYPVQPANNGSSYLEYCFPDGAYSTSPLQLCGTQCPALTPVTNGSFVGYSTAPPTTVTVQCDDGHYLVGASNTTCQRNGNWTNDLKETKCLFAQCDQTGLPDNTTGLKY